MRIKFAVCEKDRGKDVCLTPCLVFTHHEIAGASGVRLALVWMGVLIIGVTIMWISSVEIDT